MHPAAFMQQRCFSTAAPRQACNTIIIIVPEQKAIVVERFGKGYKVLAPGLNVVAPWPINSLAYEFSLKETSHRCTASRKTTRL
jgi:regulator of protease activity HflC (stomatin/prohibitin superfamily)